MDFRDAVGGENSEHLCRNASMSGFGEKSNRRRRQALTVSRQELVLVKKSGTTHGRLLSNVFVA